MENKNKDLSFEEAMNKLEMIVKKMESGNSSLDEAINDYTEGMNLAKICGDKLNSATEKVNKILTENGEIKEFEAKIEE